MKRGLYIVAALLLLGLVLFYLRKNNAPVAPRGEASPPANASVTNQPSTPSIAPDAGVADKVTQEAKLEKIFSTPINFYGKVVDESGHAVEGAQIRYSVASSFVNPEQGTVEGPVTDANGLFSITDKKGAGIFVMVTHENFHETPSAKGQFSYFENTANNPTAANPATFVLQKKIGAEPLTRLKQTKPVPKNGTKVEIGIASENGRDLAVETWTSPKPQGAPGNAPFAWKLRVSVPNGGLVPYKDEYQFEAPEGEYVPAIEFVMPEAGVNGKWRDRFEQLYFVKLSDGKYARIRFQMMAGGGHFAVVESYYNPSGSRNLEYEPPKQSP